MKKMKKIECYVFQKDINVLPKELLELVKEADSQKRVSIKKGFLKEFFHAKKNFLVLKLENKPTNNDKTQEQGANIVNQARQSFKEEKNLELNFKFEKSIGDDTKFFLEKGIRLAKNAPLSFKEKKEFAVITLKGLKIAELEYICKAMNITRSLVSKPSNILGPDEVENYAKALVKDHPELSLKVLKDKELEKENMNMMLAVNRGSAKEAKLLIFEYNPEKLKAAPTVLVGKGLMYDSGGYYQKPVPYMNEMYGDMAGTATVIGIMSALKDMGIKKRVIGVCAIAENLIDANSYRNGDILTSRKGLTVEVDHSDAEGRLVLADTLSYVSDHYKPELILDFATLTGACLAALGEMYTGIFSDNQNLIKKFQKIGTEVNDPVWPLPFDADCKEAVKAYKADLTNTAKKMDRVMGASTAAAFLSNFVENTKKWVHFDIAGTALRSMMRKSYDQKNLLGTGSMVHNILKFLSL